MPKNEMSYNLADKIITLYSNLLMNLDKLKLHEKYPYSALNGYDIIDISNAVKLNIAYRVFISDDKKPNNVAEYTEASSVALLGYLDLFYPDNIATEFNAIYGDDIQAFSKKYELTKDILKDIETQLYDEETPKSFLEYCISTGKSDPDYWKKIYDRIGITWDSSDDYDKIYINIALQYGLLNTKKTNVETKKTKSTLSIIKTPSRQVSFSYFEGIYIDTRDCCSSHRFRKRIFFR